VSALVGVGFYVKIPRSDTFHYGSKDIPFQSTQNRPYSIELERERQQIHTQFRKTKATGRETKSNQYILEFEGTQRKIASPTEPTTIVGNRDKHSIQKRTSLGFIFKTNYANRPQGELEWMQNEVHCGWD